MSQTTKIASRLMNGKSLTGAQAAKFGVTNLSARIHEMRKAGAEIRTVKTKSGVTAYTF